MTITEHAIKRYKKRIGKKTTSRKKVIAEINRDLKNDVKYRKASRVANHYILVTSKFKAVCIKSRVVTICSLNETDPQYDPSDLKELSHIA